MSYEISFENVPVGVAAESVRNGESVQIQTIAFASEEDGELLIDRLEGFGNAIISKLPQEAHVSPGSINHLLAVIRKDKSATVYVNEVAAVGTIQIKKGFEKGEAVYHDDIADIHEVRLEGIDIPTTDGFLYIFSVGWRRGIFFDFDPLRPNGPRRSYDVEKLLAQLYSYLAFQKRFKISELAWSRITSSQWFPFISLRDDTIKKIISHANHDWPIDDLTTTISKELADTLSIRMERWKVLPAFQMHINFLEKAVERYLDDDYISVASILYPRIEGILRSYQDLLGKQGKSTQKELSKIATDNATTYRHTCSPLLPRKFRIYLEEVYFANFDPKSPDITISRNSVSHGVASDREFSLKSATISLLIIDQLCHCFSDIDE